MTIEHTQHSAIRSAQRGLTEEEIEYVYQFASRFHGGGATIYYLRRHDVPESDQRWDFAMRLVGTALVVALDGRTLVTTWRNRRSGLKQIRKKKDVFAPSKIVDLQQQIESAQQ